MADLGLGSTFDGVGPGLDFTSTVSTTSGRRGLAVDIGRRFTYARGHWPRSPDRGFDLRAQLSKSGVSRAYLETKIVEQAEQDERVVSAEARITTHPDNPEGVQILLRLVDADGPFDTVLLATAVTVELLREVS